MRLSDDFYLSEFTKSQVAARNGLDNTPPPEAVAKLRTLVAQVLQRVRDKFGPVVISSGYRSPEVNKAAKGSKRSQHLLGEAADFEVPGVSNLVVAKWIRDNLQFDQLIIEGFDGTHPNSGWIHVSFKTGNNRKEVLTATFANKTVTYTEGLPG